MAGEALPLPDEVDPTPGAIIKPRQAVKTNPCKFAFDVDDNGDVSINVKYKRQRDTGGVDEEGNPVYEGYETAHGFSLTPSSAATAVEETPASEVVLKTIRRKHAAKLDDDGNELEPAWEEDVPYTRPVPRQKTIKFSDFDLVYEFHDRMLKETIIVHKVVASVRWTHALSGGKLKKVPGTTDHYVFLTDDDEPLNMKITTPTGHDAEGREVEGMYLLVSAQGQFNLVIPDPAQYTYPLTIDPSFTFDGTDFVISSAQTEVKTYQQLWPLAVGTNLRYLNGYMSADSNGVNHDVYFGAKALSTALDLSEMSDLSITVKTTGADTSWALWLLLGSDGSNYRLYSKSGINGDVDATYTLSDFPTYNDAGTPDMSAIDTVWIRFYALDTALAGGVVCQVKDYKFTTPVKTSSMYDSTGRFVLVSDDFEGDDGLALDSYDSGWAVTKAGTSVAEIDSAQAPGGGSTSVVCYYDGANNVNAIKTVGTFAADNVRVKMTVRSSSIAANCYGYIWIQNAGSILAPIEWIGSAFKIWYGNGLGGNTWQTPAHAANTDYEIWIDLDFTQDKWRCWIDGVLYAGTNAGADGYDNFYNDNAAASFGQVKIGAGTTVGSHWFDDMTITAGFEDFSALTAPHDIDDICEAVSPSGTDYGRGTLDGDWENFYSDSRTLAVDATDCIIGSNSIKFNCNTQLISTIYWAAMQYTFDTAVDLSSFTHIRFYMKYGTLPDNKFQVEILGSGFDKYKTWSAPLTWAAGKWIYFDVPFSSMAGSITGDVQRIRFTWCYTADQASADHWIDGLHFYGDTDAGICMQANSIDVNQLDVVIDRSMYDWFQLKSTGLVGSSVTCIKETGDTLTIEWSDVATAGYDPSNYLETNTWTGPSSSDRLVLTSVGDVAPANRWTCRCPNNATVTYMTHVDVRWAFYVGIYGSASAYIDVKSTCQNSGPFAVWGDCSMDGLIATPGGACNYGILIYTSITKPINGFDTSQSAYPITDHVLNNGNYIATFTHSKFDKTKITEAGNGLTVSVNHNNGHEYIISVGAVAKNDTDILSGYRPTPDDDVYIQAGTFNVISDYITFYSLASKAGTTIDTTVCPHFALLDSDVSGILGTWNKSPTTVLAVRKPTRPVPMPLTVPVMGHDYV